MQGEMKGNAKLLWPWWNQNKRCTLCDQTDHQGNAVESPPPDSEELRWRGRHEPDFNPLASTATIRINTSKMCSNDLPTQPASRVGELLPHSWTAADPLN
jgi:hypothetical protein